MNKTHEQSVKNNCFSLLNMQIYDVLAAVSSWLQLSYAIQKDAGFDIAGFDESFFSFLDASVCKLLKEEDCCEVKTTEPFAVTCQLSHQLYQSRNSKDSEHITRKKRIHTRKLALFLIASLICSFPPLTFSVVPTAVSYTLSI